MSESFSVKAILSAEDGSFRSVFGNAQSILQTFSNSTSGIFGGLQDIGGIVKNGLGFGVFQGIGQKAFDVVAGAVSGVSNNMDSAISRFDTLKRFPKIMDMMGFEGAKEASDKLAESIDGLPTSLDGITASTQNIALITGDLDGATDTAIALNNAFLMSGSSTADAERGVQQYVQMLSKGKVDQQSWNTLLDTMSPALDTVAKSFGYTGSAAKQDLYEALKDGQISFTEFNDRLVELNNATDISGTHFEGFAALAEESSKGIGTSIENMKTMVVKQMAKMIEAFDDNGIHIADGLNSIKDKINTFMDGFRSSDLFQHIIDSTKTTIDAVKSAVDTFTHSSAMQAVYDNMDRIAQNLGVILPNIIKGLEPIIEAIATVASNVFGAISDVIAKVTSNPAFMTFCQNIGKAVEKVGGIVEKVIKESEKYFGAILDAANEVMTAFGKTIDAITNTARKTDTAGKLFDNFQKVLGFVKDALIKTAQFLEKHHTWILKIIEYLPQIIALIGAVKIALLAIEKIKAFKQMMDQVFSFGKSVKEMAGKVKDGIGGIIDSFKKVFTSMKDTGSGFDMFYGLAKDASYKTSDSVTKISGSFDTIKSSSGTATKIICNNMDDMVTSASTAGSGIASGIGGGIAGMVGTIAAGIGTAVGIIGGIVTAILNWKEEQYKAGRALHEMTDEEQQFIDASKQACQAYDNLRDAAVNSYASKESDISMTELLRDKYLELLDANGKVISGKEELAEKLAGEMCESLGLEKGKVEELRGEYKNLIDSNGKVKEGYEQRAEEILGELAQAWGLEKSEIADIMGKNQDLIGVVNDVSEAKRESAKVEAINEAYKQSIQDAITLERDHKNAVDLKKKAEEEFAAFIAENGDNFTKYTDKQRGEYDALKEKIEKYDTALEENEIAQKNNASVAEIAGDARVAAAEGDTEAIELCFTRLTEGLQDHTTATREELQKQLEESQNYLNERKAAYERSGSEEDQKELERAQTKHEWLASEYELLLSNQDGYLTKDLEAKRAAAQKELEQAQAHLDELKKKNAAAGEARFQQSTEEAKALVEQKKSALDTIERDLEASLITQEALNSTHEQTREQNQAAHLDNLNANASGKLSQLTQTTNTETQNTSNALIANTRTGVDNGIREWERLAIGIPRTYAPVQSETQTITANACNGVQSTIANSQSGITAATAAVENGIVNEMGKAQNEVPSAIGAAMSSGQSAISNKQADLGSASSAATNAIVRPFGNVGNELSSKTSTAMNAAGKQIQANTTILGNYAAHLVTGIVRNFGGLSSNLSSVGSNAMIGLQNGLNARAGSVYNIASAIASNVARIMQAALQINSPSRLTRWMGRMIDEGLVLGLKDEAAKTESMAARVAENVSESMNKSMQEVIIPFPDMGDVNRQMARMTNGGRYVLNSDYNYNRAFQVTVEVPVKLDSREVSRLTVDTDSQEQYYNQKRFYR